MIRQRVRIRFRKEADLRLISHRDLLRLFERLLRRAGLQLSMSEGFHPKARISFPSALALGIQGVDEVMEFELAEHIEVEALAARLREQVPPGLAISDVRLLADSEGKAQVRRLTYQFPVPQTRREQVQAAVGNFMSQASWLVERPGRREPVDAREGVEELELRGDAVQMRLRTSRTAGVQPRDVLHILGLSDLEHEGCFLVRTQVELVS